LLRNIPINLYHGLLSYLFYNRGRFETRFNTAPNSWSVHVNAREVKNYVQSTTSSTFRVGTNIIFNSISILKTLKTSTEMILIFFVEIRLNGTVHFNAFAQVNFTDDNLITFTVLRELPYAWTSVQTMGICTYKREHVRDEHARAFDVRPYHMDVLRTLHDEYTYLF